MSAGLILLALGGYLLFGKNDPPQQTKQPPPPPPPPGRKRETRTSPPSAPPPPPPPAAPVAPGEPPPALADDRVDIPRVDASDLLAQTVHADLKQKGKNYNRRLLSEFQRVANLQQDSLYGPRTRGALIWYLKGRIDEKDIPQPFTGAGTVPYVPPTAK